MWLLCAKLFTVIIHTYPFIYSFILAIMISTATSTSVLLRDHDKRTKYCGYQIQTFSIECGTLTPIRRKPFSAYLIFMMKSLPDNHIQSTLTFIKGRATLSLNKIYFILSPTNGEK